MLAEKLFYSRKEAAELLTVSMPTIHRWMNTGIIPFKKIGGRTLIPAKALERLAEIKDTD